MLQGPFTLHFILLWIQVLLSLLVIVHALRKRTANLYALAFSTSLIVLVTGQGFWVFNRFAAGATSVNHLFQTLYIGAAERANWIITACIALYALMYFLYPSLKIGITSGAFYRKLPEDTPWLSYLFVIVWTGAFGALVLRSAGGLDAALLNPGQNFDAGLTLLIMLLGLGKLPLLRKIVIRRKPALIDILLFLAVTGIYLLNSRFLAAFLILQVAFAIHYCIKPLKARWLVVLGLVMVIIFMVFGLYREFTARFDQVSLPQIVQFFQTRTGDENPVEWFYRLNIEGFVGVAAAAQRDMQAGIQYDYGVSNLQVILQLVPAPIRNDPSLPFYDLNQYILSFFQGRTIVPPGMENAYRSFGIIGVLFFGLFLGYLTRWFDNRMREPNFDRLALLLISVQCIALVRGTVRNVILFALAELVVLFIFFAMLSFSRYVSRVRNAEELGAEFGSLPASEARTI